MSEERLENLRALTDNTPDEPWPSTWQDEFGRSDFFYVCGLTEFFREQAIGRPERIKTRLDRHLAKDYRDLPTGWLDYYPGFALAGDELQPERWLLDRIGRNPLLKAARREELTFPKAMFVLDALLSLNAAERSAGSLRPNVEIRLANWYVPDLDQYLRELDLRDTTRLVARLGGPVKREVLSQLQNGFPVTGWFAKTVVQSLGEAVSLSSTLRSELRVDRYEARLDVRKAVKGLTGQTKNKGTMQVAIGEHPIL